VINLEIILDTFFILITYTVYLPVNVPWSELTATQLNGPLMVDAVLSYSKMNCSTQSIIVVGGGLFYIPSL
jgi:hypothetical protein